MLQHLGLSLIQLRAGEGWSTRSEGLTFVLAKAGGGVLKSGESAHPVAPGDVVVVCGSDLLDLVASAARSMACWIFALSPDQLAVLLAPHELAMLTAAGGRFQGGRVFAASRATARVCQRLVREIPPRVDLAHRSQLLHMAAIVLAEELNRMGGTRKEALLASERLRRLFEDLSAESLVSLSVGELARKFGCSRRHLSRLFHQCFGIPAAKMKMELRLLRASALLRDGRAKVISVAQQSGFNHIGLFNTYFKRRFGVTPSEWRRQNAQIPAGIQPPAVFPQDWRSFGPWHPLRTSRDANGRKTARAKVTTAEAKPSLETAAGKMDRRGYV